MSSPRYGSAVAPRNLSPFPGDRSLIPYDLPTLQISAEVPVAQHAWGGGGFHKQPLPPPPKKKIHPSGLGLV